MTVLSYLVILLLTAAVYYIINWLSKRREFFKKIANIPGPKSLFLIGNALDFKNGSKDVLPTLMKYQKEYGLSYKVQLGLDNYVFTADPKLIEIITSSNSHINKTISYKFLADWLGDGLISVSNPQWKIHRRLITPTFHFNILKDFIPTFHKNSHNLVSHWMNSIGQKGKILMDIYEDVLACGLDTICETSMGISVNALRDGKQSRYMEAVKFMGKNIIERTFSSWKQFDTLYRYSAGYRREMELLGFIKNTTEDVIQRKRLEIKKQCSNGTNGSNNDLRREDDGTKKRVALLDLLMATVTDSGGCFTDKELRQEVDTFIFAGHDTIASATSFTLYCLAKNPDIQEKVYQELQQVLNGDDDISYEKISSLKYMEQVIKESLRILPTVPMYLRHLREDVHYNDYILPKGINIGIFAYGAHKNEKIYENPEVFNPERFCTEESSKRSAFAYIPFSAGPRNCIGQKFAMVEMKCLLSDLIKAFKFYKPPHVDIEPCAESVLKSLNGVQLVVEARS